MNPEQIILAGLSAILIIALAVIGFTRRPRRLSRSDYTRRWREIQSLCADKSYWAEAITGADDLLHEALQKRRKTGKTMGERMVAAQKEFSNNDAVWKAHKLASHVRHEVPQNRKLKKKDVKDALIAFRNALKDLGAL